MKIFGSKTINCNKHKNSSITHFCTDNRCSSNPLLCTQCFIDNQNRTYHYNHQKAIIPLQEAIESFGDQIKSRANSMQKTYSLTAGKVQFSSLLNQIQKQQTLHKQLENRISSIKNQIDVGIESFIKQFQRQLNHQKAQFFKTLDDYQKSYIKNLEYIKNSTQSILDFNNSIKYFANKNNLYLKIYTENKKNSDWILKTKKSVQNSYKYSENSPYCNQILNILNHANKIKLDLWPFWMTQQNSLERTKQARTFIKRVFHQWVYMPDIKQLQEESSKQSNHLSIHNHRIHSSKESSGKKLGLHIN